MTTSAPVSHLQEAQKLTADAPVDFYTLTLKNDPVIFRFKSDETVTWQGYEYEGMAVKITGDTQNSDGEESRPTIQILNPFGIFNRAAMEGKIDRATLTRRRVLKQHVVSNSNIYQQRMWYVGRVRELISGQTITLELRNMTEGANFQIPVRSYMPSEGFPMVTL